jgi:hypothetical protein
MFFHANYFWTEFNYKEPLPDVRRSGAPRPPTGHRPRNPFITLTIATVALAFYPSGTVLHFRLGGLFTPFGEI